MLLSTHRPYVLGLLLVCASFQPCFGDEATETFEVRVERDIEFAEVDGVKLLMNLHLPMRVENPPLVMYIHGGAWLAGDRNNCGTCWVAKHGYAVASIEYRMSHEAIYPAQIHDCKGALRWLRSNQDQYGYDATRVVVAGASAGGQLAALMGTTGGIESLEGTTAGHPDQSTLVQGVIDYFGATDFIMRSKNQPSKTEDPKGSVYKLFGGSVSDNIGLARSASASAFVDPSDPPILILHGDKDPVVQLTQSARMKVVYEQHKLDALLHIEMGKGHGWKRTDLETERVLDFLQKCFKEPAE
jgi:acetyl esterase/lipase